MFIAIIYGTINRLAKFVIVTYLLFTLGNMERLTCLTAILWNRKLVCCFGLSGKVSLPYDSINLSRRCSNSLTLFRHFHWLAIRSFYSSSVWFLEPPLTLSSTCLTGSDKAGMFQLCAESAFCFPPKVISWNSLQTPPILVLTFVDL